MLLGVFIHANVRLPWGPLRYVVVTPDFHHSHLSSDDEVIDKYNAGQLAFLDHLFGTPSNPTSSSRRITASSAKQFVIAV